MKGLVTNIQVGLLPEPDEARIWSRVAVEATMPLEAEITRRTGSLLVRIRGLRLNMPDCVIPAYDGILTCVRASTEGSSSVIEMVLQHDAPFVLKRIEGMPHRLEIRLDSVPVYTVFEEKTIAIDPGHGGRDAGARGPVNLLEKNVVFYLAQSMDRLCSNLGIGHYLTREADLALSIAERLEIVRRKPADMLLSLHTGADRDSGVRGSGVAYLNHKGKDLARAIAGELSQRLNLPNRGFWRDAQGAVPLSIPAVRVEFVTLTNPVDEGWVRSRTFVERAALAIINGAKNYMWSLHGGF